MSQLIMCRRNSARKDAWDLTPQKSSNPRDWSSLSKCREELEDLSGWEELDSVGGKCSWREEQA